MTAPEFSRIIDVRSIGDAPVELSANEQERAALARRFGLVSVDRLSATVALEPTKKGVVAEGRLSAAVVQSCAVSAEDLPVEIEEPLSFRFVHPRREHRPDEELELDEEALEEIEYTGTQFDLGEAVAQSLALAIDPFAVGPEAERVRREVLANEEAAGPFAALAKLKKD